MPPVSWWAQSRSAKTRMCSGFATCFMRREKLANGRAVWQGSRRATYRRVPWPSRVGLPPHLQRGGEPRGDRACRAARLEEAAPGNWRLLVVDDASPDGTGDMADRLAAERRRRRGASPPGQAGPGPGLPSRLPARASRRRRPGDRHGRRLLPRSGAPAGDDLGGPRQRSGARLALRGGRRDRRLAAGCAGCSAAAARSTPAPSSA